MQSDEKQKERLFGSKSERKIYLLIIVCLPLFDAIILSCRSAWLKWEGVAGFVEQFMASFLWQIGRPGISNLAMSLLVAAFVWAKLKRLYVAIPVGFACFFLIWSLTAKLADKIPGVDWRYERIEKRWEEKSPEDDYQDRY